MARWNDEDARWLAKAQAYSLPGAESILNKFEEHGDITYRAQFIDLLREYSTQRELERKRKEESELPGSPNHENQALPALRKYQGNLSVWPVEQYERRLQPSVFGLL